MPIYPKASYRPIGVSPGDRSNGTMHSHRGAVLHVNQSNGNLFNWFNNPANQVSAHFEVYKSGAIDQYIDTNLSSWCQANGNDDWISIETEGYVQEALNSAQLKAFAGLYAWLMGVHGIKPLIANTPSDVGLGWHGMGAPGWGHAACPGDIRKAQRSDILALAVGTQPQPLEGDDDVEMIKNKDTGAVIAHLGAGVMKSVNPSTWGTWNNLGRPVTQLATGPWTDYTNMLSAGGAANIAAIAQAVKDAIAPPIPPLPGQPA